MQLIEQPNHELDSFALSTDDKFLFRLNDNGLREKSNMREHSEGMNLNEFLWSHNTFEIRFGPNLSHDLTKPVDKNTLRSGISDGIEKKLSKGFHMRESMKGDIDEISTGEIVETNKPGEICDTMNITSEG